MTDGQHRLYGFSGIDEKYLNQNILVLAFEKLPRFKEADLFVTINHEQKSVPRNLLDILEGDLKWGSDKPTEKIGAISARLIQLMNADLGEPFYNRVAAQGIKTTDHTCLTVPEIKDGIKKSGLIGRAVCKKKVYEPGPFSDEDDEKTLYRAKEALNLYFSLIMESNPNRWEAGRQGYVCSNPGIRGFISLLAALLEYMQAKKKLDPKELSPFDLISEIEEFIEPVSDYLKVADEYEISERFKVPYGSGGSTHYYYRLCKIVKETFNDFSPDGYKDWEAGTSEEKVKAADQKIKELTSFIQGFVFKRLKDVYGHEEYLDKGVREKELKVKAFERQQDDNPSIRLPLEAYFELIELKKVVEKKYNWPHFKEAFDIPIPNKKRQAKNLGWMDQLNLLRRIPAHSYMRNYTIEDFMFIDWIYDEFRRRTAKIKKMEQKNLMHV